MKKFIVRNYGSPNLKKIKAGNMSDAIEIVMKSKTDFPNVENDAADEYAIKFVVTDMESDDEKWVEDFYFADHETAIRNAVGNNVGKICGYDPSLHNWKTIAKDKDRCTDCGLEVQEIFYDHSEWVGGLKMCKTCKYSWNPEFECSEED